MKLKLLHVGVVAALSALLLVPALRADLIHRYQFNESPGATTVEDSVGDADGVLKGAGEPAVFTGTGRLSLPGGTGSASATVSGYVDLPNHIINIHTNLTIETWITWYGSGAWERIFDFGTSDGGEDVVNGNGNYLFLTPTGNANIRFAVREPVTGTEPVQLTAAGPPTVGEDICLTVTYNYTDNVSRLFSNGVQIAFGPANVPLSSINDVNNWLGRSQWDDAMFQGEYEEFRIYNHAMNPAAVAASYIGGYQTPNSDIGQLGAVQAVYLKLARTELKEEDTTDAYSTADFANAANIVLAGVPDVTYASDNPAVATIDAKGHVVAVAEGSANISITYAGKTDSAMVAVARKQAGLATAGTLYVQLKASGLSPDGTLWDNTAPGQDDFYLDNAATATPTYVADVAGTGKPGIAFTGVEAFTGPVTTADLTGASDCSVEVWAFNPAIAAEETLVAWAHRGGPDGSNFSFNYGSNGSYGAMGHWGAPDLGWNGVPAAGQWHYLVYTFDGAVQRVYADGVLKNSENVTLNVYAGFPIRIGAQAVAAGDTPDFGQAYSGYLATVRVHGGVLSASDVRNNYFYGMDLVEPGELTSVDLALDVSPLVGPGSRAVSKVTANYATLGAVGVNPFATFSSSDEAVATVSATGVVTATGVGTATITAVYGGKLGTHTLQVLPTPPTVLVHRYSFGEAAGSTTVADSVGTAHGTVKGLDAVFDGAGKLTLPGVTSSGAAADVISGYVDLPNGIMSSLVDVSFEAWITWGTDNDVWQRIFDFGTSDGGEDVANGGGGYIYLAPRNGATPGAARTAVRDPATGSEPAILDWPSGSTAPVGTEVLMTVVYDQRNNVMRFYSNAVQLATGTAPVRLKDINDVNNWLGRSQWDDPMFAGTYNEFRIWDGALSAAQVLASYNAGPDNLPVEVTEPTLGITIGTAGVAISWPASATGFVLESTPELLSAGSTWTTVDTSSAVTQGDQKVLTLPVETAGNKYYRMRQ